MPSTVKANNMKTDTDMKIETGVLITVIKQKYLSKTECRWWKPYVSSIGWKTNERHF